MLLERANAPAGVSVLLFLLSRGLVEPLSCWVCYCTAWCATVLPGVLVPFGHTLLCWSPLGAGPALLLVSFATVKGTAAVGTSIPVLHCYAPTFPAAGANRPAAAGLRNPVSLDTTWNLALHSRR